MDKTKTYELVEVPTQTGLRIQSPEGEILTLEQAIVELLNKMDNLEKVLK